MFFVTSGVELSANWGGVDDMFPIYQFGELKEPPESPKKKITGLSLNERERQGPGKPKSSYHFFRQLDCWF